MELLFVPVVREEIGQLRVKCVSLLSCEKHLFAVCLSNGRSIRFRIDQVSCKCGEREKNEAKYYTFCQPKLGQSDQTCKFYPFVILWFVFEWKPSWEGNPNVWNANVFHSCSTDQENASVMAGKVKQ